jgi:O-acetyl-ADP-ribose deacetylase (regulator of RNase III)
LEDYDYKGNWNKLGQIDYEDFYLNPDGRITSHIYLASEPHKILTVVNAYTQYKYGKNHIDGVEKPFDYDAFTLCMRKINNIFTNCRIGLPRIGAGLAGGDWEIIQQLISKELKDCDVTIVTLPK